MTGGQAAARWPIIALALACVVIAGMLLTTIEVAYQFSLPRLALIKSGAADAMIRILPPVPPEEENAATYYDKAQAMAEEELEIYADSFSALRKLLDKGDEEAWRKVNISIKKGGLSFFGEESRLDIKIFECGQSCPGSGLA
ncbi:MAG: hypothetical protein OEZ55_05340 [Nitrospinota bacterium]|nr:hypothetical protein [Nitrospinota bacterium]